VEAHDASIDNAPPEESPMTRFNPTHPLLRAAFAAVAVLATIGTGAFIDGLARGYSADNQQAAVARPVAIATAQR
jgi:hypothetical protein